MMIIAAQHSVTPDGWALRSARFLSVLLKLWQNSVSQPFSPQPPVTRAVGRLNFPVYNIDMLPLFKI